MNGRIPLDPKTLKARSPSAITSMQTKATVPPPVLLTRSPNLSEDGFEIYSGDYLTSPEFSQKARSVYARLTPGRNATNSLPRGTRWGAYVRDQFHWLNRQTYKLSEELNPQEGGRERTFDLIPEGFLRTPQCERLFRDIYKRWNFAQSSFDRAYEIQLSAIRYSPSLGGSAEPSPPFPHQDEIDGAVIVLNKESILGGVNRIFDLDDRPLYEFDLEPGNGFLIADRRLKHYVTDLQLPLGARSGFRDVLLVRFQPLGR